MIEETVIIDKIADGQVWIKTPRGGACGGCVQQANCGSATLAKLLPKREFAVDCDLELQVGDQVRVAIDDSHLLLSSMLLYLLPLLPMLIGIGLANACLQPEIADAWLPIIAFCLLLAAFRLIHHFQDLLLLRLCFKPQIIGKLMVD